jgi:hypothetical protein
MLGSAFLFFYTILDMRITNKGTLQSHTKTNVIDGVMILEDIYTQVRMRCGHGDSLEDRRNERTVYVAVHA